MVSLLVVRRSPVMHRRLAVMRGHGNMMGAAFPLHAIIGHGAGADRP
jgi:hypothetical protein